MPSRHHSANPTSTRTSRWLYGDRKTEKCITCDNQPETKQSSMDVSMESHRCALPTTNEIFGGFGYPGSDPRVSLFFLVFFHFHFFFSFLTSRFIQAAVASIVLILNEYRSHRSGISTAGTKTAHSLARSHLYHTAKMVYLTSK